MFHPVIRYRPAPSLADRTHPAYRPTAGLWFQLVLAPPRPGQTVLAIGPRGEAMVGVFAGGFLTPLNRHSKAAEVAVTGLLGVVIGVAR